MRVKSLLLCGLAVVACGGSQATAPKPAPAVNPAPVPASQPANSGELTRDECSRVIDHLWGILEQESPPERLEEMRAQREAFVKAFTAECVVEGTRAQLDCAMKATSREEVEACGE